MPGFNRQCNSEKGRGRGYGNRPCCENDSRREQDSSEIKGVGRGGQPFGCGKGRCFGGGHGRISKPEEDSQQ